MTASDKPICPERRKPGGCTLHNLHCAYPQCDVAKVQPSERPEHRTMTTPTKDKPIVRYEGRAEVPALGASAWITGVLNHPNHLEGQDVTNDPRDTVRTSAVLAHDEKTGRIETRNTIYLPEGAPA